MKKYTQDQAGFTLIEAIMVMTITAILAAGVAVFLRKPIDGYMDLARRAELSDIADTAVRRISRDLHLALPNSVRADSGPLCLEFMPTINGGRYRADVDGAGGGNVLTTATVTGQFDVLGPLSAAPAVNDRVVVFNLGIPGADAYSGDNIATIDAATTTLIHWTPTTFQFPFTSPGNRFHIILAAEPAVTYVCSGVGSSGGNGSGVLYRYTGYALSAAQNACPATPPAGTPILAQNLSACSFTYANGVIERSGLVSIRLAITKQNETVNLYHEVHVNNVP